MKLGIVGSSFSVGNHSNPVTGKNDLALPFETWIKKYSNKNILCDESHFTDTINEEMIKDFILPCLTEDIK